MLSLAIKLLFKNPLPRVFSLISITFVLVVSGLVFSLFEVFSQSLEQLPKVYFLTAYLEKNVSTTKELEILSAVRKLPTVSQASLISKDAFVTNFSQRFPQFTKELSNLDDDTIPRYLKIKSSSENRDLTPLQTQLSKIQGIESIKFNQDKHQDLIQIFTNLRKLTLLLLGIMSTTLICISLNYFKSGTGLQLQMQNVMSFLGKHKSQLYSLFLFKGIMEGACAGILSATIFTTCSRIFFSQFENLFITFGYTTSVIDSTMLALFLVGAGIFSGMIGNLWVIMQNQGL